MFNIGAYKAPREDGFPAVFFYLNWELVGPSISNFISLIWSNPDIIQEVNETLLVLIPKIDHPGFIIQLDMLLYVISFINA